MQQECSLGRVWLEIFWVKKYLNRIRFSDTRKDVTHTSAGDTTASSCEKSMKDSFPKSFDVPMSTKPHSLSNLSRAFSCYWKQIESKWLCARSIQRLSVLGWEKKQTVTSGVLFRRMCHRGSNSPQHQKELHIKTTNFIFFSLYFQVYLCSTELTGLICRGMKRHLENSKNSTRALKIFFFFNSVWFPFSVSLGGLFLVWSDPSLPQWTWNPMRVWTHQTSSSLSYLLQ